MSEWIFPDHDPCFDEPVDLGRLESWTALARARKGDDMSTHDYRVRKRRMCQAIGLPTSTTVAKLKEAWAAEGLRWPADDEITDVEHINIEQFRTNDKENDMTKNAQPIQPTLIDVPTVPAPTTATTKPETKKETTVENEKKPKRTVADVKASYDHTIAVVREMYGDAMPIDDPINPITGRPLNRDAAQRDNLRYLAADLGWTSNEFATVKQVESYGGKVKDGAYKPIQFMPGRFYRVVNLEDVQWPNDVRPEFTPENKVEKPKDDKPKATTNKSTPKPDPKLKKLEEELAAQKKANDEMRELLAAQKASTDQMTAMFTALMAKLG